MAVIGIVKRCAIWIDTGFLSKKLLSDGDALFEETSGFLSFAQGLCFLPCWFPEIWRAINRVNSRLHIHILSQTHSQTQTLRQQRQATNKTNHTVRSDRPQLIENLISISQISKPDYAKAHSTSIFMKYNIYALLPGKWAKNENEKSPFQRDINHIDGSFRTQILRAAMDYITRGCGYTTAAVITPTKWINNESLIVKNSGMQRIDCMSAEGAVQPAGSGAPRTVLRRWRHRGIINHAM